MKVVAFLLTFTFFSTFYLEGQNIIYRGGKQYPATNTWEFKCESYSTFSGLDVQIANGKSFGYIRLAISVPFDAFYIGGPIYLFLSDGTMITCSDKGIRDHVDQKSIVLYVLTLAEIEKMKSLNIQKIRFTIKAKQGVYGGDTGNYTAENKKNIYGGYSLDGEKVKNYYETSEEITTLFNPN